MTLAYWCVLIAALLPYVLITLAKSGPGFDNKTPREYVERLTGWRKRAYWAQINSFETFPPFAAGVIIAELLHANPTTIDKLAIIFIIARILHGIFYIIDKHILRSLAWFIGFFSVIGLFVIGA